MVITFDGPLLPGPAEDLANYQITKALSNPELVTSSGAAVKVLSATYSDVSASQVTLTLKNRLKSGVFYRIFINGTPASMSVNPAVEPFDRYQRRVVRRRQRRYTWRRLLRLIRLRDEGWLFGRQRCERVTVRAGGRHGRCLARAQRRHRSIERGRCRCREQRAHRLGARGRARRCISGRSWNPWRRR